MLRLPSLFLLPAVFALAQPAFDVASVKKATIPAGAPEHYQYHMTLTIDGFRAEFANASLIDLLRTAFRVDTFQISGPDWMTVERFDVVARIPAGASKDRVPEMLQQLLATRFALAVHHEQRDRNVLALVEAKGRAKPPVTPTTSDAPVGGAFKRSFGADGSMQINIRRYTMKQLAELLGSFLGRPIADATGLHGEYDVSVSFSPEDLRSAASAAGVAAPSQVGDGGTDSSIAASLGKLGLKLEARKLPIDYLFVDHVERTPTAN